jgi:hypothetical protein
VLFRAFEVEVDTNVYNWVVAALLIVSVLFWRDPLPFAAIIAFVLLANHYVLESSGARSVRSFFGVLKISDSYDGRFRLLSHGTTLHGGQRIRDNDGNSLGGRPEPIMYYYNGSAMAQILDAARERKSRSLCCDRPWHRHWPVALKQATPSTIQRSIGDDPLATIEELPSWTVPASHDHAWRAAHPRRSAGRALTSSSSMPSHPTPSRSTL